MGRPYYGWVVVGGAFSVLFVAYGTQYSFGLFFAALLDEFGWSRASLAGAFSLYTFAYCLFGFPAGRLTDRWGPRPVIAAGGLFLAVALAGMSRVSSLWQPYLLYGVVASLGMGTAYVPCNSTVVKWFVRRRGLAVGLSTTGASLGTFALPPVAQALIAAVGWRQAYLVFAVAILIVLNLIALVMRRDPEALGLHPDGDPQPPPRKAADGETWPLRRAARTRTFWLLAAAFSATWIPVFIPLVHLPRFARDLGFPAATGAWLMSTLGLGAVCGRLIMGALSDRFGRRPVVGAAMTLQVLAFTGFATARELSALYATAFLFGYSYGTISTLFTAIVGDFFGRARAGTLVGVLFAMAGSMGGWGPLLAGALYDATGRYTPAFVLAAGLNVAAVVLLSLCRPPTPPREVLL
ncbi:MAG TPA: MFS transporter [Candidatus Binatia bacterium]|nr:MFS transporter [Candidatus Binatia bacterium]